MIELRPETPIHFRESAFTAWRRWFAWHPARSEQGGWIWLKLTWRRRVYPPTWFCPPASATGWLEVSDDKKSYWEI